MEVVQLMIGLPRRCPQLRVEGLDSEQFFGITLCELDAMAAAEAAAEEAAEAAAAEAADAAEAAEGRAQAVRRHAGVDVLFTN